MKPSPAPAPDVATPGRSRDTAATRGSRRTARRRRRGRSSLVPLPWWTSQSRISTRSSAVRARRVPRRHGDVVEEAEPHRAAGSAWWPGGRSALTPVARRPRPAARRPAPRRRRPRAAPPPTSPATADRVGVDRPAAARAQRLDRVDVAPGVHRRPAAPRDAAGASITRAAEPAVARHLGLERADALRPLRMAAGCRGRSARRGEARRARGTSGTVRWRSPATGPTSSSSGAGAAGLYACAVRRRARARASRSSPPVRWPRRPPTGPRAALAAALAVEDSPERHLEDTLAAGRGLVRRSAAEVLCDEAPDRVRDLEALGVRFDADRHGNLALGLEGGHSVRRIVHAGGSATGRRILRQLSADRRRARGDRGAARAPARPGCSTADGRCRGVVCEDGSIVRPARVVLATGGAAALWSRTTNPPGSFGAGLLLARDAGATLADLEFAQFHPTAVVGLPGPRGLPHLRGGARRGRHAARAATASASSTSWPRATRSRAPSSACCRRRARRGAPRHAPRRPGRFPNVVAALRDAGLDPTRELVPVAPASHYVMGGIATDLQGRSARRRAVRGRRVRLHRPARRQPAGVELAVGVLRVRPPRGAGRARGAAARGAGAAPSARRAVAPPPTPATREAVWRLAGLERDADAPAPSCSTIRTRSPGSSRAPRSPARRAAAPTCGPTFPTRVRTGRTSTTLIVRREKRRDSRRGGDIPARTHVPPGTRVRPLNANLTSQRLRYHEPGKRGPTGSKETTRCECSSEGENACIS